MKIIVSENIPERTVIKPSAATAPAKTVSLECVIAMMAAMKNVLSPISEIMITAREATNACMKPILTSEWSP